MTALPAQDPDLIPIAREVRLAAQSLARHVKDHTTSLAPHLFTVLAWLEDGPATAGELAVRERVTAPSMSKTVVELEDRGFVARTIGRQGRTAQDRLADPGRSPGAAEGPQGARRVHGRPARGLQPRRARRAAHRCSAAPEGDGPVSRTFSSLSIRNYRNFFIGNNASFVGVWMTRTAQAWLVLAGPHQRRRHRARLADQRDVPADDAAHADRGLVRRPVPEAPSSCSARRRCC